MSGERSGLPRRGRGALRLGVFGGVVTAPQGFLGSGIGWDALLSPLVGAVAGGVTGFAFPALLARHRKERTPPPPPPHPPGPPPPLD